MQFYHENSKRSLTSKSDLSLIKVPKSGISKDALVTNKANIRLRNAEFVF